MQAEAAVAEPRFAWPPRGQAALRHVPSLLIAIGLQLAVLPAFGPMFMRSWLESGRE